MLKISKISRHGVRALFDMAYHGSGAPVVHSRMIAARQGIPRRYMGLIFLKLKRANLVRGIRGAAGGYSLARGPGEITVGDVVRATQGTVRLVFCIDREKECSRSEGCVARDVWAEASRRMMLFFDSITLADLCDRAEHMGVPIQEEE
jgi:Rrf2 family protein